MLIKLRNELLKEHMRILHRSVSTPEPCVLIQVTQQKGKDIAGLTRVMYTNLSETVSNYLNLCMFV